MTYAQPRVGERPAESGHGRIAPPHAVERLIERVARKHGNNRLGADAISAPWCARSFKTIEGERIKVNFLVFYEIDQQTAKSALRLDEYNGDEDASWVLLEADTGTEAGAGAV